MTELLALSSLEHPHIVSLVGMEVVQRANQAAAAEPGVLRLALEPANLDLHQRLQQLRAANPPLNDAVVRRELLGYASQVAAAFEFIHARMPHLVHRDLHPHTVLLFSVGGQAEPRFDAKVAGFESASMALVRADLAVVAPIPYRAPEAAAEASDWKADVYSFGRVLLQAVKWRHDLTEADGVGDVGGVLADLIQRCCSARADVRPSWGAICQTLNDVIVHLNPAPAAAAAAAAVPGAVRRRGLRVLSISGGGSRGIIPLTVLAALEEKTGRPVSDLFDVIVGTSIGGIAAIALGQTRIPASDLLTTIRALAANVLSTASTSDLLRALGLGQGADTGALRQALKQLLDDAVLHVPPPSRAMDMAAKPFVACVTEKEGYAHPYLLRNYPAAHANEVRFLEGESGWPAVEAALATSAAHTYFNCVERNNTRYRDGALKANNPVEIAFSEATALAVQAEMAGVVFHGGRHVELLVSIGTGEAKVQEGGMGAQPNAWVADLRALLRSFRDAAFAQQQHAAQRIAAFVAGIPDAHRPHLIQLQSQLDRPISLAAHTAEDLEALRRAGEQLVASEQFAALVHRLQN